MDWQSLTDDYNEAASNLRSYRGALRFNRPHGIDRDAGRAYDQAEKDNPLMRRFPRPEKERIRGEMRAELEATRRHAAAVARFRAHGVRAVVARARDAIARGRRDVSLSPSKRDSDNHLDPIGMLVAELVRLEWEKRLRSSTLPEVASIYAADREGSTMTARLRMELIEAMHAGGELLAGDDESRAARRELELLIDEQQSLRVPDDLPDFEGLAAEADRLDGRAEALQIVPLDPDQNFTAREAHAALLDDMNRMGEQSDADDQAALRAELAG